MAQFVSLYGQFTNTGIFPTQHEPTGISFFHHSVIAGANAALTKQLKRTDYTKRDLDFPLFFSCAEANRLQGPFNILAVIPVDGLGRNVFIQSVATQFATWW